MLKFYNFQGIKKFLELVVKHQHQRQDCLIVIAGKEGSGKSTVMLNCIDYLEKLTEQEISIDQINFRLSLFLESWHKYRKKSIVVLDEGKELKRLNYRDQAVKDFEELMTISRMDANIFIICITNPLHAIRYVSEDKVTAVLVVNKRKTVKLFSGTQFWKKLNDQENDKSVKKLNKGALFQDTYKDYTGHLRAEYDAKKEHFKDLSHKEKSTERSNEESLEDFVAPNLVSAQKAQKMLKVSHDRLKIMIKNKELRAVKVGIAYKYYLEDIKNILEMPIST